MKWKLVFLPEAIKDIEKLDTSQRYQVIKGINKVIANPLSKADGGYGTPLCSIQPVPNGYIKKCVAECHASMCPLGTG